MGGSFFNNLNPMSYNDRGFTLTETLVAIAISGLVMTGVYSTFYSQQKSHEAQTQVAGMQQNIRAAINFMEREIRMAGCNPTGLTGVGIQSPLSNTSIHFTMDITDDAGTGDADGSVNDANEDITYSHYDSDGDGNNDAIGRDTGSGNQLVAENIDILDLTYLDENGSETTTPADVRSVQIAIVARTGKADPGYMDSKPYYNKLDEEILASQNDSFRRRLLTYEIQCRNLWF